RSQARTIQHAVVSGQRSGPRAFRRRRSEMITLQIADTGCAYKGRVFGALDAFRDCDETKTFNQTDQLAQKMPLVTAGRQISNVGSVDFDRIHSQMLKMAQRGVAGAKIVEGDPAA